MNIQQLRKVCSMVQRPIRESVVESIRAVMALTGESDNDLRGVLGLHKSNMSRRMNGEIPFKLDEVETLRRHWEVDRRGAFLDGPEVLKTAVPATRVDALRAKKGLPPLPAGASVAAA